MVKLLLSSLVPMLAVAIGFLPLLLVRHWLTRQEKLNRKHSPLGTDMLRPPGYSLSIKLKEFEEEMSVWIALLVTTPVFLTAEGLSLFFVGKQVDLYPLIGSTLLVGAVAYCFFASKLWGVKRARARYVLGYEGEPATAQSLDQLMLEGCRVFHDMPSEGCGNIDHIVVSKSGVFSINSKGYSKPQKTSNVAVIDYSKRTMTLTGNEYPFDTKQVKNEANWLTKFLTKSVGKPITVEAMIALPGWKVEVVGKKFKDVCVFSPRNAGRYFLHRGPDKLSPELINQITHQLDQKCRNVSAEAKIKHEL